MDERRNGEHYIDLTAYYAIRNIERKGKRKMEDNFEVYRGEIWYVEYGKSSGSEQDAGRPAVIVLNDIGNKHSNVVEVVYLTTADKKPLPTHVDIMCKVPSTALCEQVDSVAKYRLMEYVRSCTNKEMAEIDNALLISLGLTAPEPAEVAECDCLDHSEEIKHLEDENEVLKDEKSRLLRSLEVLNQQLQEAQNQTTPAADMETIIRLETERDLYKQQYELLFERMLEK